LEPDLGRDWPLIEDAAVCVAEAVAAFIIPWAEEETEDILRRTYCLCELGNHFLPEIFAPGIQ
jgi:hypothetical protein